MVVRALVQWNRVKASTSRGCGDGRIGPSEQKEGLRVSKLKTQRALTGCTPVA